MRAAILSYMFLALIVAAGGRTVVAADPPFDPALVVQTVEGGGAVYHRMQNGNIFQQKGDVYALIDDSIDPGEMKFHECYLLLKKANGRYWMFRTFPHASWEQLDEEVGAPLFGASPPPSPSPSPDPGAGRAARRTARFVKHGTTR